MLKRVQHDKIMVFFFLAAVIIALLFEGSVTTLPLVLAVLLCLIIVRKDAFVFLVAFLAGLFLDIFTVRTLGASSLFFIIFLFLILLYQRKYEINSYPFVFFAALLGSAVFLGVFGYGNMLGLAIINAVIAVVLFGAVRWSTKGKSSQSDFKPI